MRKPTILFFCLTMLVAPMTGARDLSGKFLVSAKGGLCYSMGGGFGPGGEVDGRYGVGLSTRGVYWAAAELSNALAQ
jgi:hypothetical protein